MTSSSQGGSKICKVRIENFINAFLQHFQLKKSHHIFSKFQDSSFFDFPIQFLFSHFQKRFKDKLYSLKQDFHKFLHAVFFPLQISFSFHLIAFSTLHPFLLFLSQVELAFLIVVIFLFIPIQLKVIPHKPPFIFSLRLFLKFKLIFLLPTIWPFQFFLILVDARKHHPFAYLQVHLLFILMIETMQVF